MKGAFILILITVLSCKSQVSNKNLNGEWVIKKTAISSFPLHNNCKEISLGDKFIFTDNDLIVLKKGKKCTKMRYIIRNNKIKFLYSDFSFKLKIKLQENNNLILISKILPEEMMVNWKEEYWKYKKDGYEINLLKIK
ncbi:conserved protein of unknown function [Tenacibaculum sp. 190524A02b]|uniref:hypothetical protein n=1 Tax=Tenacibaculum vairaonense TaxID=3137860 RepID=UPI0032B24314